MNTEKTVAKGAAEIAKVIGEDNLPRVYYALAKGHVPGAQKRGRLWILSIPQYRRAIHGEAA